MAIIQLNSEDITIKQLLDTLVHNEKEYSRMKSEIKKLEEIELNQMANEVSGNNHVDLIYKEETSDDEFSYEDAPDDMGEDFEMYFDLVKNIESKDNLHDALKEALPSKNHYTFEKVITKIKLKLLEENKEIEELLDENEYDDIEVLKDFRKDVILNNLKIKEIIKISNEELTEEEEKEKNHLIFVPTTGGNIRIIEDLKDINSDKYEKVLVLLNSIKDGTFKDFKRFKNNDILQGICEVRDRFNHIRIIFKRLVNNNYAVISVFVKNSTSEGAYRTRLNDKVIKFNCIVDSIISKLTDPEFLKLHKMYEEEVIGILNDNNISEDKSVDGGKQKGGNSDDE